MTPAQIIAKNLAALPHPDGTTRQLPGFTTQLLPEALQQQVSDTAKELGEAIIHLLEINGYRVTDEPSQPTQTTPLQVANLHCAACDTRLMQMTLINPEHVVTNGRLFLEALKSRSVECPHT